LLTEEQHGLAAVLGHANRVTIALKQVRQKLTHAEFVIDYEKVGHREPGA
jgi:hypothetical protein